jgi:excisionase family DNA binding protein
MQNDLLELKNDFQTFRKELQEIKQLTALSAKTALNMKETAQLMGVSTSHLYKLVCGKKIPYYKRGGKMTYFPVFSVATP